MLTKEAQNIKDVFGDTKELVKAIGVVRKMNTDHSSDYYLAEVQVHMTGLYREALLLQRQNKQLQAKLAKATKAKPVKKAKKPK